MVDRSAAMLRAVTGQIDWWWHAIFRPRLDGLTDEEFRWEPVPGCWTLHPAEGGMTRADFHWPPPNPTPFTTIAWRLQHIGVGCLAARTTIYFPDKSPEPWNFERYDAVTSFPATATEAIAFLDRWWTAWRAGLADAGEAGLWEPCTGVEGDFPDMQLGADDPFIGMVLHQHRELMHHGAEVNLLRDLYSAQQPRDPFVEAVLLADRSRIDALVAADPTIVDRYRRERPDMPLRAAETERVDSLRVAIELGFDVNVISSGVTPLHHVIAGGHIELVRALIDLGADVTIPDATWNLDALGWADYFHHDAIADYLRQR